MFLSDPEGARTRSSPIAASFSDGASAVVLANEAGLAKLNVDVSSVTEIVATGYKVEGLGLRSHPLRMANAAAAAAEAYRDAGIGPKDVGVAELHDCFSITEVQFYQALGFAETGKGTRLLKRA